MPDNRNMTEEKTEGIIQKAYNEEYGDISQDSKKGAKGALAFGRVLTALLGAAVLFFGFGFAKASFDKNSVEDDFNELESKYESEISEYQKTIDTMERTYIYDNGVSKTDVEIYQNVAKNPYSTERFITDENGLKHYTDENGNVISAVGIDLSYYQGDVYWDNVANSGVEFAIIRAGYRGYATGEIAKDSRFDEYINGAIDAGIDVGIYFFSQAINEQEAVEEANFVISLASEYDIDYPIVFDWEYITGDSARTDSLSRDELTNAAIAFCNTVKSAGYEPMIYGNAATLIFRFDLSRLSDYDFWLAQYYDAPSFFYDFKMWQYTSSGIIDGISNYVDLNVCMKKYTD